MDNLEYAMKLQEKIEAFDMNDDDRPPLLDMLLAIDKADGIGAIEAYERMTAEGKLFARFIVEEFLSRLAQRREKRDNHI